MTYLSLASPSLHVVTASAREDSEVLDGGDACGNGTVRAIAVGGRNACERETFDVVALGDCAMSVVVV
jgi:hypothetical protein